MRYDKLLIGLEKARTAYENTVRELINAANSEDAQVDHALRIVNGNIVAAKDPKGRSAKSAAWTPARRRKQARLMKQRMRAKKVAS